MYFMLKVAQNSGFFASSELKNVARFMNINMLTIINMKKLKKNFLDHVFCRHLGFYAKNSQES